jgi:hypothetical protein
MTPAIYFNLDLTLTRMTKPFGELTAQVFAEAGVPSREREACVFG